MKNKHRTINRGGYVSIYKPEHPQSRKSGYIFEHRYVMSQFLGRLLLPFPKEIVHHKNRNKSDNRIENLEILSQSRHFKDHGTQKLSLSSPLAHRFRKGENHWFGRHHSEESKEKISIAKKGVPNLKQRELWKNRDKTPWWIKKGIPNPMKILDYQLKNAESQRQRNAVFKKVKL